MAACAMGLTVFFNTEGTEFTEKYWQEKRGICQGLREFAEKQSQNGAVNG